MPFLNFTPEMVACARLGKLAGLAEFLDAGVEPDEVHSVSNAEEGRFETTALKQAIDAGQLDAVRLLLDRGADPNLLRDGHTPLMTAVFTDGRAVVVPMIELLLERGADLDRVAEFEDRGTLTSAGDRINSGLLKGCQPVPVGWTAFHYACSDGEPDVVEALMRAGCDTSIKTEDGRTGKDLLEREDKTLHVCERAAVLERLAVLEREDKRRTKMSDEVVDAAQAGAAETLTRLLDAGGDANAGHIGLLSGGSDESIWASALYAAASTGQVETARVLLSRGADPNLRNSKFCTPLMTAARYGRVTVMELLLEHGADATAATPESWTAFHYACSQTEPGCAACGLRLVRAGCDMNAKTTESGWTGKQLAELHGNTALLELLAALEKKEKKNRKRREQRKRAAQSRRDNDAQPSDGVELEQQPQPQQPQQEPEQLFFFNNPLHEEQTDRQLAAEDQALILCRKQLADDESSPEADNWPPRSQMIPMWNCDLVGSSASSDEPTPEPEVEQLDRRSRALTPTPRITTSARQRPLPGSARMQPLPGSVRILAKVGVLAKYLDAGGDPNAFETGKVLQNGEDIEFETTALMQWSAAGQFDAVRLLLDRGSDPNLRDSFDATALIQSVSHAGASALLNPAAGKAGYHAVVELLVERGAALDLATNKQSEHPGSTAFHYACAHGEPDIVEVLVRAGCDTSVKNMDGDTGKQVAQRCKSTAVLERLVALDRKNKKRSQMNQDVVVAAEAGASETLTGLLDAGGDANAGVLAMDGNGKKETTRALYFAAYNGHLEAARVLLGRGADPNLGNTSDVTPLMTAACKGQATIVELLLEHGADARTTSDNADWTAFHFACWNNELRCAELVVLAGCDVNAKTITGRNGKQLAEEQGSTAVLKWLSAREKKEKKNRKRREQRKRAQARVGTVLSTEQPNDEPEPVRKHDELSPA
jgi:ankyrin repeat protein